MGILSQLIGFLLFRSLHLCLTGGVGVYAIAYHHSFLKTNYLVQGEQNQFFAVRQVPGDGSCLFHALTACITYASSDKHYDFDSKLRGLSTKLRQLSVEVLQSNCSLYLEHGECLNSLSLLEVIGEHYGMSGEEYCRDMLKPRTWGGGPEIVALSNHFQCPIHVYQLSQGGFLWRQFRLKLTAKFGSPNYDNNLPLQILSADGRFPDIAPGKHKPIGDHFLALFPCDKNGLLICSPNGSNRDGQTLCYADFSSVFIPPQRVNDNRMKQIRRKMGIGSGIYEYVANNRSPYLLTNRFFGWLFFAGIYAVFKFSF